MNAFPDFTPLLAYYMAKETDQFLRKTLFEEGGTFASLMLSDHTYVNGRWRSSTASRAGPGQRRRLGAARR